MPISTFLWSGGPAYPMREEAAASFESALEKAAFINPAVVFRGLCDEYSDLVRAFLLDAGNSIQPGTFQSVFTHQAVAHDLACSDTGMPVVLKIHVPAEMPAIALDQFLGGSEDHKYEIILPRNITYMVDKLCTSSGKLYADVTAEFPNEINLVEEMDLPKRTPIKLLRYDQLPPNPAIIDHVELDAFGCVKPAGPERELFLQIGPRHYEQIFSGRPILDRRSTRAEMLGRCFSIGQFISQGRVYKSGMEADLGFLKMYRKAADGYFVMIYPEPEIEPGDFESPVTWD